MRHRDQDDMRRQPEAFKPGFMESVSTKHAPFSKTNSIPRSQDYGHFRY